MRGVKISYLHPFSDLVSKRSEMLQVEPGFTISGLIKRLFDSYTEEFKKNGIDRSYSSSMLVALNGKVLYEEDWDTELRNDDSVLIGMAIAGGQG